MLAAGYVHGLNALLRSTKFVFCALIKHTEQGLSMGSLFVWLHATSAAQQ